MNEPNNSAPTPPMNDYEVAYLRLFNKLSPDMQKRVLAVRDNNSLTDKGVDDFVKSVIALAEQTEESKKIAEAVKSDKQSAPLKKT